MAGSCSICAHPARVAIDDALVSSTPLRDIVRRFADVPLTISSLSRHNRSHVSPALQAVIVERQQAGAVSALDRLEDLYARDSAILDALQSEGNAGKSLQAVQVLAGVVEKLARVTGELDDRPVVAVNLQSSGDWTALRSQILDALAQFPEARQAVVRAISGDSSPRVIEAGL